MARWITASASGSLCQQSATTRTSVVGRIEFGIVRNSLRPEVASSARGAFSFGSRLAGYRPLRQSFVSSDDPRHQFVADHVLGGEFHLRDALDAIEQLCGFGQARGLA